MITGRSDDRHDGNRGNTDERLEAIERKLEQHRAGGGGIGCCGLILFLYTIYLLHQVLDRLGG